MQEESLQASAPRALTPKQTGFLNVIRSLIQREDGLCPTLQEMAEAAGVTKATAQKYVGRLKAAGHLTQAKGKSRTIRPVDRAA